jgi:hypothetical protein
MKAKLLLIVFTFLFEPIFSDGEEIPVFSDENVSCFVTKLTGRQAADAYYEEINGWIHNNFDSKQLPFLTFLTAFKIPEGYVALKVKITNNSDKSIYLPAGSYLNFLERQKLEERISSYGRFQNVIACIPIGIGTAFYLSLMSKIWQLNISDKSKNIVAYLTALPAVATGAIFFINNLKKVNNFCRELKDYSPFFLNGFLEISPGKTLYDVVFVDESNFNSVLTEEKGLNLVVFLEFWPTLLFQNGENS